MGNAIQNNLQNKINTPLESQLPSNFAALSKKKNDPTNDSFGFQTPLKLLKTVQQSLSHNVTLTVTGIKQHYYIKGMHEKDQFSHCPWINNRKLIFFSQHFWVRNPHSLWTDSISSDLGVKLGADAQHFVSLRTALSKRPELLKKFQFFINDQRLKNLKGYKQPLKKRYLGILIIWFLLLCHTIVIFIMLQWSFQVTQNSNG